MYWVTLDSTDISCIASYLYTAVKNPIGSAGPGANTPSYHLFFALGGATGPFLMARPPLGGLADAGLVLGKALPLLSHPPRRHRGETCGQAPSAAQGGARPQDAREPRLPNW